MLELIPRMTIVQWLLAVFGFILFYVGSTFIYNVYFHPLAKFPGPKLAAMTHLWFTRQWIGGRFPFTIDELHTKFGDIVRIAPDELSIASAKSLDDIYGHSKEGRRPFLKSAFYDSVEDASVSSERDPEKHRVLRRMLSHAFSTAALRDQTSVVIHYVNMFVDQISKQGLGKEGINIVEWYNWITFDIIGDLSFGESFGAVEQAKSHYWVDIILESVFAQTSMEIYRRIPILKYTTILYNPFPKHLFEQRDKHQRFGQDKVNRRLQRENNRDDFFSHILSNKAYSPTDSFLLAQALIFIVAGSETVTSVMSGMTYYLLQNPDTLKILQDEVRGTFEDHSQINSDSASKLPFLCAVIEEALRIFPPVGMGLPRTSPGAMVDGHYIPAGTIVSTAAFYIGRSPKFFHNAKLFRPQRWLSPEHPLYESTYANDHKAATKPFLLGPRVCLGMNLAYMELRIILAKLVWSFDWELTEEARKVNWERDMRMFILWKKPELMVRFLPSQKMMKMKAVL